MGSEHKEMGSLGLFGVYKETYMLVSSYSVIFSQIIVVLICTLTITFLLYIDEWDFVSRKMTHQAERIIHQHTPDNQKLSELLLSELITLLIFKLRHFISFTIISFFPTSVVAYSIAFIYTTGDQPAFEKVLGVFRRVWKRILATFLCTYASFFTYTAIGVLFYKIWTLTIGVRNDGLAIFWALAILYLVGIVYLDVIWNLASVMSVLEDSCGLQAMIKSTKLIKGKSGLAIITSLMFSCLFALVNSMFMKFIVHGWTPKSVFDKLTDKILFYLVFTILFLFELVIQTVVYFVCKSYHHENIDKLILSDDHQELYVAEDAPLMDKRCSV